MSENSNVHDHSDISRRRALQMAAGATIASAAGGSLLLAPAAHALGVPSYSSIKLEILGEGQPVGEFRGSFSGNPNGQFVADTFVNIRSDVYSVESRNVETWSNGVLTNFSGQGDNNGDAFRFEISGQGNGLSGRDLRGRTVRADQSALPTTYWNRNYRTTKRVINTLEGTDFGVRATELGTATIDTAWGPLTVNQVQVQGTGLGLYKVILSYDGRGDWTGMSFNIFGYEVVYRRVA